MNEQRRTLFANLTSNKHKVEGARLQYFRVQAKYWSTKVSPLPPQINRKGLIYCFGTSVTATLGEDVNYIASSLQLFQQHTDRTKVEITEKKTNRCEYVLYLFINQGQR